MNAPLNESDWAFGDLGIDDSAIAQLPRFRQPAQRLVERSLLAYPEAFGAELAHTLSQARECVLRDGNVESREHLLAAEPIEQAKAEVARVRRMLATRPTNAELAAPALVYSGSGVVIALAHPVPHGSGGISARLQLESHPESASVRAERIHPTPDLLLRWAAIGHETPPDSVWRCSPPSWFHGDHRLAIELTPTPSGFAEAMLIAHRGAGRVLVTELGSDAPIDAFEWRRASVMPSGWSYLRADRTMGSSRPIFPNGAPRPVDAVRVPNDLHFAMCALRTWTLTLRDAMWLCDVRDRVAKAQDQQHRQGDKAP